jgi:hypothetical protein
MVAVTREHQVGDVGGTAIEPVDDVVCIDETALGATREGASAVADHEEQALTRGRLARAATQVEGVGAFDLDLITACVTAQAPHRVERQLGAVVEVAPTAVGVHVHDDACAGGTDAGLGPVGEHGLAHGT